MHFLLDQLRVGLSKKLAFRSSLEFSSEKARSIWLGLKVSRAGLARLESEPSSVTPRVSKVKVKVKIKVKGRKNC
ncbi:hypothetical protein Hanom_Chr05g00416541 [Helianthus anomalus]